MLKFDLVIIGSGFGGSILAMIARQLGKSVAIIERGTHPRFAIGESSTPLANLLIEELSDRYSLSRLKPLAKWGTWQKHHPQLGCGLKRGFSFVHHTFGEPLAPDPDRQKQLLVAASPRDEIADTHWYRPDFDRFLVEEAVRAGACYFDLTHLRQADIESDGVRFEAERRNQRIELKAAFVVDASGPRGFLHRMWQLPEVRFRHLPRTEGLFAHFTGVRRLDAMGIGTGPGMPPYQIDDAAVHHVFPGGWIWVLQFNNGIVSAGVAATESLALRLRMFEGEPAWNRLLDLLPSVREQFASARATVPFVHAPKLSFRSGVVAGPRWALLPSAAGFVDPLLSTGFTLTLLGIERLAEIFNREVGSPDFESALADYSRQTLAELDRVEKLIACLYSTMDDFALFAPLSLLYFAAVSFAETARRLNRTGIGREFLLGDHLEFSEGFERCCALALELCGGSDPPVRAGILAGGEECTELFARGKAGERHPTARAELLEQIERTVALVDVAGLGDKSRRNWFPAQPDDVIAGAGKLGATVQEIEEMIRRCM